MPKDRVKSLFALISSGDASSIRQEANRILEEIQEEQAALTKDAKLVKEILGRYGGPADNLSPGERSAKVREAALAVARNGKIVLTIQDVLDHLMAEDVVFDIKRPGSLVGTVLSQMKSEFAKLEGTNQFRFIGSKEMAAQDAT